MIEITFLMWVIVGWASSLVLMIGCDELEYWWNQRESYQKGNGNYLQIFHATVKVTRD